MLESNVLDERKGFESQDTTPNRIPYMTKTL